LNEADERALVASVTATFLQHEGKPGAGWLSPWFGQFDEMHEQSREAPLVMGIAPHSMIVGQPIRLRQLRRAFAHLARHREAVWITMAGEIARNFAAE